jgi:ankyrin repeat protein
MNADTNKNNLFQLAETRQTSLLVALLNLNVGVDWTTATDDRGQTLLSIAAKTNNFRLVRLLCRKRKPQNAMQALCEAVRRNRLVIAQYLLFTIKVDPNVQCSCHSAFPLTLAVKKNLHAMTSLLLKHGADPNARASHLSLPPALEHAAMVNDLEMVRRLLCSGGDFQTISTAQRWTSLDVARKHFNHDVERLILRRPA